MFLEVITDFKVAIWRCVEIPADGVASGPVAVRHRADIYRHANAVAGIVLRATYFRELPTRAQITGSHLGVGFETTRCQNNGFGCNFTNLAFFLHFDAADFLIVVKERENAGLEKNVDSVLLRNFEFRFNKAGTATPCLDAETAPEFELPVDLESLATVAWLKANAFLLHPLQGRQALGHQNFY